MGHSVAPFLALYFVRGHLCTNTRPHRCARAGEVGTCPPLPSPRSYGHGICHWPRCPQGMPPRIWRCGGTAVTLPGWVTAPFAPPWSGGMAGGWGRLCLSGELLFARHGTGRSLPLHVLVKQGGKGLGMLCVTPQDSLVKTTLMGACFFGLRCVIPSLHSFPTSPRPRTKSYWELKMEEFQAKLESLLFCCCHMLSTIKPLLVWGECVSRAWDCWYPCVSHWFPASPCSPHPLLQAQPSAWGLCRLLPCPSSPIFTMLGWPRSPTAPPRAAPAQPRAPPFTAARRANVGTGSI